MKQKVNISEHKGTQRNVFMAEWVKEQRKTAEEQSFFLNEALNVS